MERIQDSAMGDIQLQGDDTLAGRKLNDDQRRTHKLSHSKKRGGIAQQAVEPKQDLRPPPPPTPEKFLYDLLKHKAEVIQSPRPDARSDELLASQVEGQNLANWETYLRITKKSPDEVSFDDYLNLRKK